jgi:hypothetical protein
LNIIGPVNNAVIGKYSMDIPKCGDADNFSYNINKDVHTCQICKYMITPTLAKM